MILAYRALVLIRGPLPNIIVCDEAPIDEWLPDLFGRTGGGQRARGWN